jgi:uncharacterized protein (TIGR02145 family)
MKKTILLFAGLAFLTFKNQAQTVVDIDGNVYNTLTIGTQVWLKENLKVTHYRNGDMIVSTTPDTLDISSESSPKYQWSYKGKDSLANIYGKLYTWHVVTDNRYLCPLGWHIPDTTEWSSLINYLGGNSLAGGKLKEIGTTHWNSPNTGADNTSDFTALPSGSKRASGKFNDIGTEAGWWTITPSIVPYAFGVFIEHNSMSCDIDDDGWNNGYSVRCIKDGTTRIMELNNFEKFQIYPNPTVDRVIINYTEKQNIKMQIYNVVGECVLKREFSSGTNDIDISSLMTGIYIIQLTGADWTVQRKLIKD